MAKKEIGKLYDAQAAQWLSYEEQGYSWRYIERPAFDNYIPDLYTPHVRVLDVGCGSGRVAAHLISKGIKPQNITGIDPSKKLLASARRRLPGVHFRRSSLEDISFDPRSFDLVVANMVFHYLDNDALERGLDKVYDCLRERGTLFFVDTDPDYDPQSMDPQNLDKWLTQKSPWGTELPIFNRHPRKLLTELLDLAGFDLVRGWPLKVSDEGKEDLAKYAYYTSRPRRIGARYVKVDLDARDRRRDPRPIPSLTD